MAVDAAFVLLLIFVCAEICPLQHVILSRLSHAYADGSSPSTWMARLDGGVELGSLKRSFVYFVFISTARVLTVLTAAAVESERAVLVRPGRSGLRYRKVPCIHCV